MNGNADRRTTALARWGCGLLVLLPLAAGCAAGRLGYPAPESVARQRQRRDAEAHREFDAKRDDAEFQAALNCWNQQDAAGCQERLDRLLARNPKYRDARLLATEVHLAANNPREALKQADQLLKANPADPDAQYAMGLSLDAAGRSAEALAYYERAAKADPDNEVYTVGYETARDASSHRTMRAAPPPAESEAAADPAPAKPASSPPVPSEPISSEPAPSESVAAAPLPPVPGAPAPPPPPRPTDGDVVLMPAPDDSPAQPTESPEKTGPARRSGPGETSRRAERSDFVDTNGPALKAASGDKGGSAEKAAATNVADLTGKAYAALNDGASEQALAYFRAAASLRPDDRQIVISAATAALRHNQPELAIKLLAPEGKAVAETATVYRILGTAHYRRGDYRSAQAALQRALSLDKSNALSYLLMGCTLSRLGQTGAADGYFRQARALDPRYSVQR